MKEVLATPFLAEDSPISAHAREVLREICDAEAKKVWAPAAKDDDLDPERMRRVKHTYEEIQEQPDKVKETLVEERIAIQEAAREFTKRNINRVFLTGCGDSIASVQGVRYFLEEILGIPCIDIQALDFAYYSQKIVDEDSLVIMLSSSGKTLRTLEAMYMAQEKGAQTLALTNTKGSIMDKECTRGLLIHAQRKGWPTQSSSAAMAMIMQLGIFMARERGYDSVKLDVFQAELDGITDVMKKVTADCEEKVKALAEEFADRSIYLFSGAGPSYSAAFFGAAKVKEATPNYAMTIPLEEFHHYNSIKPGDPIFVIAPSGPSTSRAKDTLVVGRNFGGKTYIITTEGENDLAAAATDAIFLPSVTEYLSSLVYSIPVQMFGYYVSMAKYNRAKALLEK